MCRKFYLLLVIVSHLLLSDCILSLTPHRDASSGETNTNDNEAKEECLDEAVCADKLGFDAIVALHKILDDDKNGAVDVSESDEFLREELQYENGYEKRHNAFHLNDKYISVKELWDAWKKSEVHNWTVDDAIQWLISSVELPQYVPTFQENGVDGTTLPRLAVNNMHFLTNILGIKDPIHKQKLALKAMDVVLFGSPKFGRNFFKDVVLVTSLVIAVGGCWFAFVQHRNSQHHLKKMIKDLDSLKKAEEALMVLHDELDKARQEHKTATLEKKNLEKRLQNEIAGSKKDPDSQISDEDKSRLKLVQEELRYVRDELRTAEKQLEEHRWLPPPSLQHWLQLTHELELRNYNAKKAVAEAQLAAAKEGCEKLRKKRSSLMGAFRVAHGSSIDDVDSRILQAKSALTEVTQDLKERLGRWRQIEALCGFAVVNNPGLMYLQSVLQGSSVNGTLSRGSLVSASQDDLDEAETLSAYVPSISAVPPSYAQCTAWPSDLVPSRHSPPHRELHSFESGSHPNLSSLTSSSSGALGHHSGNGNISPTVKRSQSAGAETLEPIVKQNHQTLSHDNLKAVMEEDSGLSLAGSNSLHSSHFESDRPVFSLGEGPVFVGGGGGNVIKKETTYNSSESEALVSGCKLKPPPSFSRFIKSHSQEHSSPPKEVPQTQHSSSESSLNLPILRKKKSSLNPLRNPVSTAVLDEENSTDSGSIAEDDSKKEKKKRFTLPGLRRSHKHSS